MIPRCVVPVLVMTAMSGAPAPAAAQGGGAQPATTPAAGGSGAPSGDAEALFKKGIRLYSQKKWSEAEEVFRQVWALNPTFDVAYNLGSAAYQQGKHAVAAEYLSFALRHFPLIDATAGLRKTAEQRLAESRAMVGTVTVKVNVAGSEVLVDGEVVGSAPLEGALFVESGKHTVAVRREGFQGQEKEIEATKGGEVSMELMLVRLDQMYRPPVAKPKPPSRRTGEQSLGGVPVVPAPADGPDRTVIGIGVGGGVTFVTAGVLFLIASGAKDSDRARLLDEVGGRSACWAGGGSPDARCGEVEDASASERTYRGLGIASFIAGGVALGATLGYALWPREQGGATTGARVVPMVNGRGGGIVALGTF